MRKDITVNVNGRTYTFSIEPRMLLIELLRNELGLTGTKEGCGTGSCGCCTVNLDGLPVKSCSVLAMQANGKKVVTIEGLADGDRLHPIQEAFVKNHALACGYCTPGMIMLANAMLTESSAPTLEELREAVSGHICRCGTYPKVIESIQEVGKKLER